jgi:hypothetical protein
MSCLSVHVREMPPAVTADAEFRPDTRRNAEVSPGRRRAGIWEQSDPDHPEHSDRLLFLFYDVLATPLAFHA